MPGKTYVCIAPVEVKEAFDNKYKSSSPKRMNAALARGMDGGSSKLTTRPPSSNADGFYLDGSLSLGKTDESIEAELKMVLADWPEKSKFNTVSSRKSNRVANPDKIDKDVDDVLDALVDDVLPKVIKEFEKRAIKDDDIKTENYKKNVKKLVDEWNGKMKPLVDQMDRLKGDLNKLEIKKVAVLPGKKPSLSLSMRGNPQDKIDDQMDKKREELQKKGKEFREKAEDATADFRKKLALESQPDKLDLNDSKRIQKLADWVKGVVQDGIPVGKYVKIPLGDLGFDFDKFRAKSGSISFQIEF